MGIIRLLAGTTSRQAERMAGGVSYREMLDESDGVLVDRETHT